MADYLLPEENDPQVAASSINRALTGGVHWGCSPGVFTGGVTLCLFIVTWCLFYIYATTAFLMTFSSYDCAAVSPGSNTRKSFSSQSPAIKRSSKSSFPSISWKFQPKNLAASMDIWRYDGLSRNGMRM